jgi:hypothetical protein
MTTTAPGFSGIRPYPFLVDPLCYVPTRPRPPPVNKGPTPVRRPQGVARSSQEPGPFTIASSPYPGDGRPLPGHVATATSTAPAGPSPLRHRLRVLGIAEPSLDSIKEKADGSPMGGRTNEQRRATFFSTSEINISSNTPLYYFLETWDRFPLSQLVTPTQALRCKEMQYSSPPLDVGPSSPEPG